MSNVRVIPKGTPDLDGYAISEIDDAGNPAYYGYINKNGNWFIMQENVAAKTYRYAKGASDYTTNWTNRASLTYDYFYNVF